MSLPDCLIPQPVAPRQAAYSAALDDIEAEYHEMKRSFDIEYRVLFGCTPEQDMRRTSMAVAAVVAVILLSLAAVGWSICCGLHLAS